MSFIEEKNSCKKSVLLLMGSHRSHKNTAFVADKIKMALTDQDLDVTYVDVNKLDIKHCTDCGFCHRHYGECVFKDDMTELYRLMKASDHVIVLSPVYMNTITSRLKVIVDRCQMIFICDFVHKRPFVDVARKGKGILVSIGGPRGYKDQFYGNELTMDLIFKNLRLPLAMHKTFAATDHVSLWDRDSEVEGIVEEIVGEVIGIEA